MEKIRENRPVTVRLPPVVELSYSHKPPRLVRHPSLESKSLSPNKESRGAERFALQLQRHEITRNEMVHIVFGSVARDFYSEDNDAVTG